MRKAFSIPHTRRHLKFIWEVQEALEAEDIPYEAKVEVYYEAQQSDVDFLVSDPYVERAKQLVVEVSRREWKKPP